MTSSRSVLLVGEIIIDFTLPRPASESKLRLGGIVHAARGLWAIDAQYSVAAFCPKFIVELAKEYLERIGCEQFIWLGDVIGSPNVMAIADQMELADQGYEGLLFEAKRVEHHDVGDTLNHFELCLIFPGSYSLEYVRRVLPQKITVNLDIAYDIGAVDDLEPFQRHIETILTSTSSKLFKARWAKDVEALLDDFHKCSVENIILKENRGGSRLFAVDSGEIQHLPAQLGETQNSVGVGDVYSAVFVALSHGDKIEAAWKAARAATCYARTTYPDDFKRDVQRSHAVGLNDMRKLGGTSLPWHDRPEFHVYFAAPDFSYTDREELDRALKSLEYHNFRVRRPVEENGELDLNSPKVDLHQTYIQDVELLKKCSALVAVPLDRDPGTLVEIGIAIEAGIPVITYDPQQKNKNTMVIAGSHTYSHQFDDCLSGLFEALSLLRTIN